MNYRITPKEKELFEALRLERTKASEVFKTRGFRGMWNSVIYKYPEKAHFVYELLQNADDVKATEVDITLTKRGLEFKHNGSIHFSISEENEDVEPYGHINAITGVGNSTKSDDVNKIGKFGVGFKAVFQYTNEPHIYDDKFWFKIVNYVIPESLNEDHPHRKEGETLFYFPFASNSKAYKEIRDRLWKLDNPILFLKNLKKVTWREENGDTLSYSKTVELLSTHGKIKCEQVEINNCGKKKSLIMFSKPLNIIGHGTHDIQLGYYLTDEGNIDVNVRPRVFCFFPTSEKFNLCFVCHAPFLLTDSRQQLKADEELNKTMILELADLQAQSLLFLRDMRNGKKNMLDENIFDIISLEYDDSDDEKDFDTIVTQEHFYESCKKLLSKEKLLLSASGDYIMAQDAYTCNPVRMMSFFKEEHLQDLKNNKNYRFLSRAISSMTDKDISSYLTDIGVKAFEPKSLAKEITPEFMEKQNHEWIASFYKFINDEQSSLCNPDNFRKFYCYSQTPPLFLIAPIIKTTDGNWISPYKNDGVVNVYLPLETQTPEYRIVHKELVEDPICAKFIRHIGIKELSQMDFITHALAKYEDEEEISKNDIENDFETIFSYYHSLKTKDEKDSYLSKIKDDVKLVNKKDGNLVPPTLLYDDSIPCLMDIIKYEEDLGSVDFDFYNLSVEKHGKDEVCLFMNLLGVNNQPRLVSKSKHSKWQLSDSQKKEISSSNHTEEKISDVEMTGISSLFINTQNGKEIDIETARYIWSFLASLSAEDWTICTYRYKYYNWHTESIHSILFEKLNTSPWLLGKMPSEVTQEELTQNGFVYSEEMFQIFGIEKDCKTLKEMGASEAQIRHEELGAKIERLGLTIEELEEYARMKELQKRQKQEFVTDNSVDSSATHKSREDTRKTRNYEGQTHERPNHDAAQSKSDCINPEVSSTDSDDTKEDIETKLKNKWDKKANAGMRKPVSSGRYKGEFDDFSFDSTSHESPTDSEFFNEDRYDSSYSSEPSSSKAEQNIKKKNTEAQNQAEQAEEQLEIYDLWVQTPKYTFLWYKYLMELMYAERSKSSIRSTKIDFFDSTLINGNKILRLLNPSTVVPSWVENPDNLSIVAFNHGEKTVVKASVVRVDDISVDLLLDDKTDYIEVCSKATMFRLAADNSMGVIDALNTRFIQLNYEDDFNLEENLPEDIEFIYGPPGTGKTTRLVEILHDIIKNATKKTNILVLTPTNKAADVIAKRLAAIDDCWACLSRYGATEDTELIEDYGVLTTRDTMDMDSYDNNIVVTTAARYPYDTVKPNDEFICDYPWDYIIVDEASMIDIVTITYILHKGNGAKFYIAGDPKQIRPIEQGNIDVENIYQMLGINELKTAIEDYKRYPLEALTTQYRSVPTIGKIVSEFAYNGLVKTNPNRDSQKPLELDGLNVNTLNFIGFGTKEFDLLYELSAINESSFNLYSAIFTYNMVDYVIKQISEKYPGKKYSIGVVCPYKAQSEAIKQLLEECPIETEQSPVTCGTVHSFQGDECDIMFVVMNPRRKVSPMSFINNQNIINVAMSRARDYLFFVMPNEKMKGFTVKDRLGKLAGNNRSIMFSHDIEKVMFGDEHYIEKNTQITCHMPVNVYYESNAKYEVRINDEALDIQIK